MNEEQGKENHRISDELNVGSKKWHFAIADELDESSKKEDKETAHFIKERADFHRLIGQNQK